MGSITSITPSRLSPVTPTALEIVGTEFGTTVPAVTVGGRPAQVLDWSDTIAHILAPIPKENGIIDFTGPIASLVLDGIATSTVEYMATFEGRILSLVNGRLGAGSTQNGFLHNWKPSMITGFPVDPRTYNLAAGDIRAVSFLKSAEHLDNARVARHLEFRWYAQMEAVKKCDNLATASHEATCLLHDLLRSVMLHVDADGLADNIVVVEKAVGGIDGLQGSGAIIGAGIKYVFDLQHIENDATQDTRWTM